MRSGKFHDTTSLKRCVIRLSLLMMLVIHTPGYADLIVENGDVVFGALADPLTAEQQNLVCFDATSGQLGPCAQSVEALPEALRVAVQPLCGIQ